MELALAITQVTQPYIGSVKSRPLFCLAKCSVGVHVHQILIVGDKGARREDMTRRLTGFFTLEFKDLQTAFEGPPQPHTLIDIDLGNDPGLLRLKEWLKRKPENAKIIFLADR